MSLTTDHRDGQGTAERAKIRIMRECSVDDCHNRHNSHGYCQAHSIRFLRYGDPLGSFQRPERDPVCSVEGCTKPNERKGLCQMHHWRLQVHGDVNYEPAVRTCTVPGCGRKHDGHGYCQLHLNRWRNGLPLDLGPKEAPAHRYRIIKRPDHPLAMKNGRVAVHRMVLFDTTNGSRMPCFWCGKPLEWFKDKRDPSALYVDHRDHDRHNNHPTNLLPSCNSCNAGRIKGFTAHRVPVYSEGLADGSEAGNRVGA